MKLYKYCSYSANTLSILIDRKVWYSKPANFNDPFDGDFLVNSLCTFKDYMKLFKGDISEGAYELMKAEYCDSNGFLKAEKLAQHSSIAEAFKNIGVLCLSPRGDSTLMWSHYADKHQGFTIQFEVPTDIPICRISYAEELPRNHLSYYYQRTTSNGYIDIEFTKHVDWKYEDEYRLSVNKGNRLVDIPGNITEINFGCKMPDSHKATLCNLALMQPEGKDIKLFSAKKFDALRLIFMPYSRKD